MNLDLNDLKGEPFAIILIPGDERVHDIDQCGEIIIPVRRKNFLLHIIHINCKRENHRKKVKAV